MNMNNKISRVTFNKLFNYTKFGKKLSQEDFKARRTVLIQKENSFCIKTEHKFYYANLKLVDEKFKRQIKRIGFVLEYNSFINNHQRTGLPEYVFHIAPEYFESVKNLFDLALSPITGNVELAFYMFQNLRSFVAQTQIKP